MLALLPVVWRLTITVSVEQVDADGHGAGASISEKQKTVSRFPFHVSRSQVEK